MGGCGSRPRGATPAADARTSNSAAFLQIETQRPLVFERLMNSAEARAEMMKFAEGEYSDENLKCWEALSSFRRDFASYTHGSASPEEKGRAVDESHRIIATFLTPGADHEVTLPSSMAYKKVPSKDELAPRPDMFDKPRRLVYKQARRPAPACAAPQPVVCVAPAPALLAERRAASVVRAARARDLQALPPDRRAHAPEPVLSRGM